MHAKIRVLIAENSLLMRKVLANIINSDPNMQVIGEAKNGKEVLEKIAELKPDVVTLDINLPLLNGIDVLEYIMKRYPTPVVIISAYSQEGTADTIKALELGAVDFISKPRGEVSLDMEHLKDEIIAKIKLAYTIDVNKLLIKKKPVLLKKVVIIGASTGGPKMILAIVQDIPDKIGAAFLIIQHMPEGFTASFAEKIAQTAKIDACEAQDGDIICPNKIWLAKGGYHMALHRQDGYVKIKLTQGELVNFVRPSIDITMKSAADIFGKNIIAVVLSGMGKDGLEGVKRIKEKGGFIIAQDKESSIVWGMPRAVCKAGLADKVLPIEQISGAILEKI